MELIIQEDTLGYCAIDGKVYPKDGSTSITGHGTLMGLAIGNAVGAGYAKHEGTASHDRLAIAPVVAGPARGVTVLFQF